MKSKKILERLYPEVVEPDEALEHRRPRGLLSFSRKKRAKGGRKVAAKSKWGRRGRILALSLLVVTFWAGLHLHYYNKLVGLEFEVQVAWAQVETQLQRRHHIQQNLTQMVLDYAAHERDVLTAVTKLRTSMVTGDGNRGTQTGASPAPKPGDSAAAPSSAPSAAPPKAGPPPSPPGAPPGAPPGGSGAALPIDTLSAAELRELAAKILVVAEQYPQLKLSENFQQFSAAMIDTETDIAARTATFNDAVNAYGTETAQFPGNVFASLFGFPEYEYYQPDEKALVFEGVKY